MIKRTVEKSQGKEPGCACMCTHIENSLDLLSQEIASIRYMLLAMVTMLYGWSPELIHLINGLPAPDQSAF